MTPPALPESEAVPRDPSLQWGWVMGVVWLVFLGFPIAAVVTSDRHWAWRALGIALVLLFATVYVHGFVRLGRSSRRDVLGWGWKYVAALILLAGVAAALAGFTMLGMVPFIVAMGMFVLPLAAAYMVFAAAVVATSIGAWTIGGGAWFMVGIVGLVGVATGAGRLLEQAGTDHRALAENLLISSERERVARDVHDVLGHSLTVVSVKAELAERLVDTDPERARTELVQIQQLTRQALAEIRSTVGGLRTVRLTDQIEAARVALADAGIDARLPEDVSMVEPRHRVVLAWALREAVTNVVRHSAARTCVVELGSDWLSVVDDGRGLRGRREGNGLHGLRERANAAGGTVTIGPGAGGPGTCLKVQL